MQKLHLPLDTLDRLSAFRYAYVRTVHYVCMYKYYILCAHMYITKIGLSF